METNMFQNLNADEADVMLIDSLCLNCYEQGVTRLMMTQIPFFREIIISSFQCEHCNFSDSGIQSGGQIQEKGVHYKLTVKSAKDLNRQVIKSDFAHLYIPELHFEQPSVKKGEINTVEGFLDSFISGLLLMQDKRKEIMPESAEKIEAFIEKLKQLKNLEKEFTVIIDDSSGNSFIENPYAPAVDDNLIESRFIRSKEQDEYVGCLASQEEDVVNTESEDIIGDDKLNLNREVLSFPVNCPECKSMCDSRMQLLDIPHFKQVVVMATVCDNCGHRDNEVRSASGVEALGQKITLHVLNKNDLSRDVIKSDTASVTIPELEFEMSEGTLGGIYTTVEGLISKAASQLSEKNPFIGGDSAVPGTKNKITEFCLKLKQIITGDFLDFYLIIDDPAGNSFIQNLLDPETDPQLRIENYERNFQQNDELGLNDMNTENYLIT